MKTQYDFELKVVDNTDILLSLMLLIVPIGIHESKCNISHRKTETKSSIFLNIHLESFVTKYIETICGECGQIKVVDLTNE